MGKLWSHTVKLDITRATVHRRAHSLVHQHISGQGKKTHIRLPSTMSALLNADPESLRYTLSETHIALAQLRAQAEQSIELANHRAAQAEVRAAQLRAAQLILRAEVEDKRTSLTMKICASLSVVGANVAAASALVTYKDWFSIPGYIVLWGVLVGGLTIVPCVLVLVHVWQGRAGRDF